MSGINIIRYIMDKIKEKEAEINYYYKPYIIEKKSNWKRHILYKEIIADFTSEISSFGFNPYIEKEYKEQMKDPRLMRFRKNPFQNYLYNYIKKSNKPLGLKTDKKEVINKSNIQNKKVKIEEPVNEEKENNFLMKGLTSIVNKKSIVEKFLSKNKKENKEPTVRRPKTVTKREQKEEIKKNNYILENSIDKIFPKSNNINIYKKFEMLINSPYLVSNIEKTIPEWTKHLEKNKKYNTHLFGRTMKEVANLSCNDITELTSLSISQEKEKYYAEKRMSVASFLKKIQMQQELKKSKSQMTKRQRLKDLYEIENNKYGIIKLAKDQKKRDKYQQGLVDEENKGLSKKDPLILYGYVNKKTRKNNKIIDLNSKID